MLDSIEEQLKPIPELFLQDQWRFWMKVEKKINNECWMWFGALSCKTGYGRFSVNNSQYLAHRISYFLEYGEPGKIRVLHNCNIRKCVNPKHLYLGTQTENMQQCALDGRAGSFGKAKLYDTDIQKIKELSKSVSQAGLAKMFGVHNSQISKLLSGKIYGSLCTQSCS